MSEVACQTEPAAEKRSASDEGTVGPVTLHAGALNAILDSGELRYVRFAGVEVLRRIYVAVRDTAWGTIPPKVQFGDVAIRSPAAFEVCQAARHAGTEGDFSWQGQVTGQSERAADGSRRAVVRFEMRGLAKRTFLTNRTGLCVLHPIAGCAGARCQIGKTDGSILFGSFPAAVSPHTLFSEVRSLSYRVGSAKITICFEGEAFETEDQRNWGDGSFKTYCRPLSRPFPYELKEGEEVRQAVTVVVEGPATSGEGGASNGTSVEDDAVLSIGPPVSRVPLVGTNLPHGYVLSEAETDAIRSAGLSHLRLDLTPSRSSVGPELKAASERARATGLYLEIALHLSASISSDLEALSHALSSVSPLPPVARWIVYEIGRPMPSRETAKLARDGLSRLFPGAPVGIGTIGSFAEVNRDRLSWEGGQALAIAMNPQVHGTDDATIIESVEAPACVISTVHAEAPWPPVWVGPVTFHRRTDPFAVGNAGRGFASAAAADHRFHGALGAAWATGCLAAIAGAGVEAITFLEAAGPFGITVSEGSQPPIYHVLRAMAEFTNGEVLSCSGLQPLSHTAFALRKGDAIRLVVANLRPWPSSVQIKPSDNCTLIGVRSLDVTSPVTLFGSRLSQGAYGVSAIDYSATAGS